MISFKKLLIRIIIPYLIIWTSFGVALHKKPEAKTPMFFVQKVLKVEVAPKLQLTKITLIEPSKPPIQIIKPNPPKPKQQTSTVIPSANTISNYARSKLGNDSQFVCLTKLWGNESGWEAGRINPTSFAVGIPQSYPPTKLYPEFHSMQRITRNGKLYLANPDYKKEVDWGLGYILNRYKTPCGALAHYNARVPIKGKDVGNWY